MLHVYIAGEDAQLAETTAETFRAAGWTTSVSEGDMGMWVMLKEWNDHQPNEPVGVELLVERENKDNLIPLFDTCRQLRDRVVEDVISVGVMTDDIKGVRMIGVEVAVPYRGSPEDLIGPLGAGIEGRMGRNPSS